MGMNQGNFPYRAIPTDVNPVAVTDSVSLLRSGGVIAYPTDTVYGLGANAFDESALARVFAIKSRPANFPLPLLFAQPYDLLQVANEIPDIVWELGKAFWPGPLTLILNKAPGVSNLVTAYKDTVAVRIPNHPLPRAIIQELGTPITGTSANVSGQPELTTAAEVCDQLGDKVDLILTSTIQGSGEISTILDVSGQTPMLIRQGAIDQSTLEIICGPIMSAKPN